MFLKVFSSVQIFGRSHRTDDDNKKKSFPFCFLLSGVSDLKAPEPEDNLRVVCAFTPVNFSLKRVFTRVSFLKLI